MSRGVLLKTLGMGVRPAYQNPITLFMTKICNFPYPIYDLTLRFLGEWLLLLALSGIKPRE